MTKSKPTKTGVHIADSQRVTIGKMTTRGFDRALHTENVEDVAVGIVDADTGANSAARKPPFVDTWYGRVTIGVVIIVIGAALVYLLVPAR